MSTTDRKPQSWRRILCFFFKHDRPKPPTARRPSPPTKTEASVTLPHDAIRCSTWACPDKDRCKRWLVGLEEDWLGLHRYGELPVSEPGQCDQIIHLDDPTNQEGELI